MDLLPPHLAKASATLLFLPPTETLFPFVKQMEKKEIGLIKRLSVRHVVMRSATPQLSKKVLSFTDGNMSFEKALISLSPILIIAA